MRNGDILTFFKPKTTTAVDSNKKEGKEEAVVVTMKTTGTTTTTTNPSAVAAAAAAADAFDMKMNTDINTVSCSSMHRETVTTAAVVGDVSVTEASTNSTGGSPSIATSSTCKKNSSSDDGGEDDVVMKTTPTSSSTTKDAAVMLDNDFDDELTDEKRVPFPLSSGLLSSPSVRRKLDFDDPSTYGGISGRYNGLDNGKKPSDRAVAASGPRNLFDAPSALAIATSAATSTTIMDEVDHVSSRVGLCSAIGLVSGAAYSAYKGLPRRATSIKVCISWTLVGTALFTTERIGHVFFQRTITGSSGGGTGNGMNRRVVLTSHAFSGISGGGILGYLYQRQPVRGMVVFTPIMLGVGFLELYWNDLKVNRWSKLQQQIKNDKGEEE